MNDNYILAVHFQFMKDGRRLANQLFESETPFFALLVPNLLDKSMQTEEGEDIYERIHSANNYYPEWAKEMFRENKNNPNIIWGQEGYRHCCGRCFDKGVAAGKKFPDPYHEHICLDGHVQSLEKQIELIWKGKNLIMGELGINSIAYCPPNHLYNQDTLKAARKNGFSFFLTRNGFDYAFPGMVKFLPYREETGLLVFPETKMGKSPVRMSYYEENQRVLDLLPHSVSFMEFPVKDVLPSMVRLNERLILKAKQMRDAVNSLK